MLSSELMTSVLSIEFFVRAINELKSFEKVAYCYCLYYTRVVSGRQERIWPHIAERVSEAR